MTKKAKVSSSFFRPTVLHDHAASRLEKTGFFHQLPPVRKKPRWLEYWKNEVVQIIYASMSACPWVLDVSSRSFTR